METYLVGGAVRDKLLNIENNDRDWVVVGATPDEMLAEGYIAVGKDFPVFLHPQTKEEYALARTERKTGAGYKGFACFFSPSVTIEDDLLRRDLTINAIAATADGQLIDPFNGQQDIEHRVLRHVSDAFVEDPLRVLRVARFAAKFHHLGFIIAPETLHLMTMISTSGELNHLTAERVWQEWYKALKTPHPEEFIRTLYSCQALDVVLPELTQLLTLQPQERDHYPSPLAATQTIAACSQSPILRFAAMVYDLGKNQPPETAQITARQQAIKSLCLRLKVPNEFRDMALLLATHERSIHQIMQSSASAILSLLNQIDVWRKPEQLEPLLLCCEILFNLRNQSQDYPQASWLKTAYAAAQSVQVKPILDAGFKGQDIRKELDRQRRNQIANQLNLID